MKIKTYFKVLLIIIITIPMIILIFTPFYFYLKSPERLLIKGVETLSVYMNNSFPKEDIKAIRKELNHMPPDIAAALYDSNGKVLVSSMRELPANTFVSEEIIYSMLSSINNEYTYQIFPIILPSNSEKIMLLSRVLRNRNLDHKKRLIKTTTFILFFVGIFEVFCIVLITMLATTISRSIMFLEKSTQRIAAGELDEILEEPKNFKFTNEITSLTKNLEKMRASLKENQEKRSRFIMGMSHDLRTPVAVIKGYTEALSDGVVTNPEKIQKSLHIITKKTSQLEGMIDTLISFEKLNLHEWRNSLTPQFVESILKDFAQNAILTGEVFNRNISAKIEIDKELKVPIDKQLFLRALENIYSNALRYSRDGDDITILGSQDDKNIFVSIRDTGIGISDKDKEHIFDTFYRASSSRREDGMGIGLAVVKNIIENHGWTIRVETELEKGSNFIIIIPYNVNN